MASAFEEIGAVFKCSQFYQHRLALPAGAGGTNVSIGISQITELREVTSGRLSTTFTVQRDHASKGVAVVKHFVRKVDDPTGTVFVYDRCGHYNSLKYGHQAEKYCRAKLHMCIDRVSVFACMHFTLALCFNRR